MYMYMYMYMYPSYYLCVYLYMHFYMYLYTYVYTCMKTCTHVRTYVRKFFCTSVCNDEYEWCRSLHLCTCALEFVIHPTPSHGVFGRGPTPPPSATESLATVAQGQPTSRCSKCPSASKLLQQCPTRKTKCAHTNDTAPHPRRPHHPDTTNT